MLIKAKKNQILWQCPIYLLFCSILFSCASAPKYYRNNRMLEFQEHEKEYWFLSSMTPLSRAEILKSYKAAVPKEEGVPQFKDTDSYDLSRFYFVKIRRQPGTRVAVQRFTPVRLTAEMRVEGLSYKVFEFELLAGRYKGRRFHTFDWIPGKTVTDDKAKVTEAMQEVKRRRFRRRLRKDNE